MEMPSMKGTVELILTKITPAPSAGVADGSPSLV